MPSSSQPPRGPDLPADLQTLSLAEVLRALGLDHAADTLDAAIQKAIAQKRLPDLPARLPDARAAARVSCSAGPSRR